MFLLCTDEDVAGISIEKVLSKVVADKMLLIFLTSTKLLSIYFDNIIKIFILLTVQETDDVNAVGAQPNGNVFNKANINKCYIC